MIRVRAEALLEIRRSTCAHSSHDEGFYLSMFLVRAELRGGDVVRYILASNHNDRNGAVG